MEIDRVDRVDEGDTAVLLVHRDLDLASVHPLFEAAQQAFDSDDVHRLTLDLSSVGFVDSTGLGALVEMRTMAHQHDTEFILRQPSARVENLLRITSLDGVFVVE